jgi:methyl-accepting chemotaxis protein
MDKTNSFSRRFSRLTKVQVAVVLAVGFILPCAYLAFQASSYNSSLANFTSNERVGILYLRPVNGLIVALSDGESAAVRNDRVNTADIQAAVSAVNAADAAYGSRLATQQRWSDLRQRIATLIARPETGQQAFSDYSNLMDLAVALVTETGDTSNLILDPGQDSYHIVVAAMVDATTVLVDSGQMADLVWLGSKVAPKGTTEAEGRVFAARDGVAQAAADIDTNIQTAFGATQSTTLAASLAGPLDQFRSAISEFAPVTSLAELSVNLSEPQPIYAARSEVESTGSRLQATMFDQLDQLLQARQDELNRQRQQAFAAVGVAVVAVGWIGWILLPARRAPDLALGTDEAAELDSGRHRAPGLREDEDPDPAEDGLTDLIDARELLAMDELTRSGRAVRSTRRGVARDAE